MLPGRVAPSAIVAGESVVGGAEVGRSDYDRPLETPSIISRALDLKASSTALAIVEQSSAQRSSVGTITLAVEVPIPTGSSCHTLGQMEERLAQVCMMKQDKKTDVVRTPTHSPRRITTSIEGSMCARPSASVSTSSSEHDEKGKQGESRKLHGGEMRAGVGT